MKYRQLSVTPLATFAVDAYPHTDSVIGNCVPMMSGNFVGVSITV